MRGEGKSDRLCQAHTEISRRDILEDLRKRKKKKEATPWRIEKEKNLRTSHSKKGMRPRWDQNWEFLTEKRGEKKRKIPGSQGRKEDKSIFSGENKNMLTIIRSGETTGGAGRARERGGEKKGGSSWPRK